MAGGAIGLAYQRASLRTATVVTGAALVLYSLAGEPAIAWLVVLWLGYAVLVALNVPAIRQHYVTRPFLRTYRRLLPVVRVSAA